MLALLPVPLYPLKLAKALATSEDIVVRPLRSKIVPSKLAKA
jgi:hypothetical protein